MTLVGLFRLYYLGSAQIATKVLPLSKLYLSLFLLDPALWQCYIILIKDNCISWSPAARFLTWLLFTTFSSSIIQRWVHLWSPVLSSSYFYFPVKRPSAFPGTWLKFLVFCSKKFIKEHSRLHKMRKRGNNQANNCQQSLLRILEHLSEILTTMTIHPNSSIILQGQGQITATVLLVLLDAFYAISLQYEVFLTCSFLFDL